MNANCRFKCTRTSLFFRVDTVFVQLLLILVSRCVSLKPFWCPRRDYRLSYVIVFCICSFFFFFFFERAWCGTSFQQTAPLATAKSRPWWRIFHLSVVNLAVGGSTRSCYALFTFQLKLVTCDLEIKHSNINVFRPLFILLWRWGTFCKRPKSCNPSTNVRGSGSATVSTRTNELIPGQYGVGGTCTKHLSS